MTLYETLRDTVGEARTILIVKKNGSTSRYDTSRDALISILFDDIEDLTDEVECVIIRESSAIVMLSGRTDERIISAVDHGRPSSDYIGEVIKLCCENSRTQLSVGDMDIIAELCNTDISEIFNVIINGKPSESPFDITLYTYLKCMAHRECDYPLLVKWKGEVREMYYIELIDRLLEEPNRLADEVVWFGMDCEGDDYVCVGKTSTDVEGILRSKRKEN